MRLLLDTHVLLWTMQDAQQLSKDARTHLQRAEDVFVSAVSLWEIAIKAGLGKLEINQALLTEKLAEAGFKELPITWEHSRKLSELPSLHRDPFDRMLVAQAMCEPMLLLTHDAALVPYSELVILV